MAPPPMVGGSLQTGAAQRGFVKEPGAVSAGSVSPWQHAGEQSLSQSRAGQEAIKRQAAAEAAVKTKAPAAAAAKGTPPAAAAAAEEAADKPWLTGWQKAKILGGVGLAGAGYLGYQGTKAVGGAALDYAKQPAQYGYQGMGQPGVYNNVSNFGGGYAY